MLFCLAPIREAVKYENQISQGLIEQEAEKTQSFIHEFLFYITDIIERNSEHLINPIKSKATGRITLQELHLVPGQGDLISSLKYKTLSKTNAS